LALIVGSGAKRYFTAVRGPRQWPAAAPISNVLAMSGAEEWVTVATGLDEARANDLALVLTARGLVFERRRAVAGWELWVPFAEAAAAAAEIGQYRRENLRAVGPRELTQLGGAWYGVAAFAVVLMALYVALHEYLLGFDWLGAGRAQSAAMRAGEWWRAVTALTLHIELDHLGGNLAFGAFFGYFLGRYLGAAGWLAVIFAGALGNALNALVEAPGHTSIGASTAVFAALGLLAAYTWRRGFLRDTPWRARIAPVVAALGLLAFTGTAGENTDLGAHLFGFLAGFAGGVSIAAWLPSAWLKSARVQAACAVLAALVLAGAWAWGLAVRG
jgi:membrane associated rhomboid family serine protease